MHSGVIDGPKAVLFNALAQMTLTGMARLRSCDIPTAIGKPYHDEVSAPQFPPINLLEDGSFSVDSAIRVAASPRARANPIRCKRQELAPLQNKCHMELRVVGLGDATEADECLDLTL
jgi:hypothetical protein